MTAPSASPTPTALAPTSIESAQSAMLGLAESHGRAWIAGYATQVPPPWDADATVVSVQAMREFAPIAVGDGLIWVGPGWHARDLQAHLREMGLASPISPEVGADAEHSLGGIVATGGAWGATRDDGFVRVADWVVALDVVTSDGEVLRTGAPVLKSVTGYELTRLFIGSRGTLGVIARIALRCLPTREFARQLPAWDRERIALPLRRPHRDEPLDRAKVHLNERLKAELDPACVFPPWEMRGNEE